MVGTLPLFGFPKEFERAMGEPGLEPGTSSV